MRHFFLILMFVSAVLNGLSQFSSSSTVYAYEYEYTDNDGIKSKNGGPQVVFVNFQNGIMEKVTATKREVQSQLSNNPNYYTNLVISRISNTYDDWKRGPHWEQFPSQWNDGSVSAFVYNSNNSTYSTYTYQSLRKTMTQDYSYGFNNIRYKQNEYWGTECWSFKSDYSTLIIWSVSDPGKKRYYKQTSISNLKPNLDFLE